MGRKSRQKKLKRKQKIEARLRELSHAQRKGLIHKSVQSPLEDLTYEDRTQLLRDRGEEAKERFDVIFPEVRSRILEFDPILLLSVLSAYSQFSEFGHDSEIHDEDMVGQAHIELLQALALQQNLSGFEFRPLPSSEAFDFRKRVAELFQVQLQSMWAQFDSTISDREMRKRMLLSMLRENTRMVRNWAYFHQLRHIVSSLFSSFDKDIQKELGVGVNELWQMLENIMHRMEEYLNDRMKRLAPLMKKRSLHSVVRYYFEIFPETQGTPDQLVVAFKEKSATVEQAKWMLLMHADLHLPDAFTFTIDDFVNAYPGDVDAEKLSKVLGKWSLAFGDLASVNPEHLFLANPIWKKPLIALEQGVYFWPIPGLLNSFGLELFEQLVEGNEKLTNLYQKRRATWLEDEIEKQFKEAFPGAEVFRGSKWHDPKDQKVYENDIAVKVGNTLVVIEAKSARIHPTARRGAPDRFERVVKDLVIEPSRQSKRFVDYLQQHGGLVTLDTDAGHQNIINVEDVVNYVRFNITLESLGVTGGRWPELQDAGLIQPEEDVAPTLNIADLNSVFEALEGACQKLHYLSRRSEFEKDCVYVGDELDLLVFYLDTGFDVPSFEEGNMVHMLTLLSKSLDPYLMAKARPDLGVKVDKPKLRLTQWWQDILRRFELQHFERWTQAGSLLLDVGFENQSLLEREFKDIKRNVKRNGDAPGHECAFAVRTNQHSRGIAVAAFAYKGLTLEQRDAKARNVADEILDQFGGEYVLIIGIDVDKEAELYPYSFSAVVDASNKDK